MAFFVNKLIKHDIVQKLSISIDNLFECITVELCLKQKIYVSCAYKQPQSSITYITDHMDNMLHSLNGNLYVCGDINIDLSEYDRKSNKKYFIDHFMSMSLYPLTNKPTYIIHGCHTIIDNILANGVIIDHTSDHFQIFCCTNFVIKNAKASTKIFNRTNDDKAFKSSLLFSKC